MAATDDKFDALRGKGYTGTVSEMMFAFLNAEGGPSPVAASMADAWMRYLKFHTGLTRGTYVDLLHDYLEPKGYPGNLTDQLGAWYAAGMPV